MGQEKVTEYEQISEPDQGEVAAEEIVKDWPDDVELGAVDPTAGDDESEDEEEDEDEDQDTTVYADNKEGDA